MAHSLARRPGWRPRRRAHDAVTKLGVEHQVARETGRQTRRLVNETKQQLRSQADEQTHRVGGALHTFGERLEALANGEPENAGVLGEYAEQFASQTHGTAQKVDELGFDGVIRELSGFARRRPGGVPRVGGGGWLCVVASRARSRRSRRQGQLAARSRPGATRWTPRSTCRTTVRPASPAWGPRNGPYRLHRRRPRHRRPARRSADERRRPPSHPSEQGRVAVGSAQRAHGRPRHADATGGSARASRTAMG